MNKKYNTQIKDYSNQLQKTEGMLEEFARQSDVYEHEIDALRGEIEKERRKSSLLEEQSTRKLKALLDQNNSLSRKLEEDQ